MGFKSVKNDGGMMKPGDYEVFVKECGYSVTKNGNDCIKFDFVVRDDVEQEYQKKHIFKFCSLFIIFCAMDVVYFTLLRNWLIIMCKESHLLL